MDSMEKVLNAWDILRQKFLVKEQPKLEESRYEYRFPFPDDVKPTKIETDPIQGTHHGAFAGAIDFHVPLGTKVLAARRGKVTDVVDNHDEWGNDEKFKKKLNYAVINHGGERTEYCHLARGSAKVQVDDEVEEGEVLGETGLSGWMDKPHLHFFVYRGMAYSMSEGTPYKMVAFKGLKPRFKSNLSS